MKALSLHQPHTQLCITRQPCDCGGLYQNHDGVDHGNFCSSLSMVKRIETRSWACPPAVIGQPLAIHATKRRPEDSWPKSIPYPPWTMWLDELGERVLQHYTFDDPNTIRTYADWPLPLGAVVGSCRITASPPIVSMTDCSDHAEHICHCVGGLLHHRDIGAPTSETDISDQLPYGDFTPGRYAWIIESAVALPEPVPCKGHQRIWTLPDDVAERVMAQL